MINSYHKPNALVKGKLNELRRPSIPGAPGGETMESASKQTASGARFGYMRVVNGTGIFLHTGLGRAPFSRDIVDELGDALSGYTVVEIDPETGARDRREKVIVDLLKAKTGAESGLVVNNNAAAVLLALTTLARGGEVIISRGELVEIGGGFRVPDVLAASGAHLREVGSTNRTRIDDYAEAVTSDTRLLMRVHASNYRIVGEKEGVTREELVALGRERSLPVVEDLGGGLLRRYGVDALAAEPTVDGALGAGVDLVTFSGDKLLGGPQSGLLLGSAAIVDTMRAAPLFRALRPDKMTLALLERVVVRFPDNNERLPDLPFFKAITRGKDALRRRADEICHLLAGARSGLRFSVEASEAYAGSGAVPAVPIPSFAVIVKAPKTNAATIAARLRQSDPPVWGTVKGDALRLDVMTLLPGDEAALESSFRQLSLD